MILRQQLAFARVPQAYRPDFTVAGDEPLRLAPLDQVLFDRFTAEIEASAASCAALLTYHAACRSGFPVRLPDNRDAFTPYVPLTAAAVTESPFAALIDDVDRLLDVLVRELSRAKATMEQVLTGDLPERDKLPRAVAAAVDPLRCSANLLSFALADLATLLGRQGRAESEVALRRLRGTLRSAAQGGTPLLVDGQVMIPETEIVIRGMRRSVDSPARLWSYGRSWKVRLQNVSQGGYCVSGVRGVEPGDHARLILASGRELLGSIKWAEDNRAGVMLASRLMLADPLINR